MPGRTRPSGAGGRGSKTAAGPRYSGVPRRAASRPDGWQSAAVGDDTNPVPSEAAVLCGRAIGVPGTPGGLWSGSSRTSAASRRRVEAAMGPGVWLVAERVGDRPGVRCGVASFGRSGALFGFRDALLGKQEKSPAAYLAVPAGFDCVGNVGTNVTALL